MKSFKGDSEEKKCSFVFVTQLIKNYLLKQVKKNFQINNISMMFETFFKELFCVKTKFIILESLVRFLAHFLKLKI